MTDIIDGSGTDVITDARSTAARMSASTTADKSQLPQTATAATTTNANDVAPSSSLDPMQIDNEHAPSTTLHPSTGVGQPSQRMKMETGKKITTITDNTKTNDDDGSSPNAMSASKPQQQQQGGEEKTTSSSSSSSTPPTNTKSPPSKRTSSKGEKAPRQENTWLRSKTSVGDGYSKIVSDLRVVNDLLNAIIVGKKEEEEEQGSSPPPPPPTPPPPAGGEKIQEAQGGKNQHGIIQNQRLAKLERGVISIQESQQHDTLKHDCNVPSMVQSELQRVEIALQMKIQQQKRNNNNNNSSNCGEEEEEDEDAKISNGNLQKAKDMLDEMKSFAIELALRLEVTIQSYEEKKEDLATRSPKFKSTASHLLLNGSNIIDNADYVSNDRLSSSFNNTTDDAPAAAAAKEEGDGTAKTGGGGVLVDGPKLKGKKSAKSLKLARQNYEHERATTLPFAASSSSFAPMHLSLATAGGQQQQQQPQPNKIQFLASQPNNARKDFSKRVSFDGTIVDRIAAVSSEDVVGLESTLLNMKDNNATQPAAVPPYPASSEAMNGVFPTMAPPMSFPSKPPPSADIESSLKRKKKKGKKRGRDKSSLDSLAGISDAVSSSGPKKKKSRGRKSEGKKGNGSNAAKNQPPASPMGMKPPPPMGGSPGRLVGAQFSRILPDPTPQHNEHVIITDESPHRIVNPLLRLPQFPDGPPPHPVEEVPQAGELWNLANVHYCEADTYPVSYLARVLGFDVPEDGAGQEFGAKFDPMTVGRCRDDANDLEMVRPKSSGSFGSRNWRNEYAGAEDDNGMSDDLNLSFCDPLWANILSSYRGYNEEDFKDAGKGFTDELSSQCLDYGKDRGVLEKENGKGLSFRFGTGIDIESLKSMAEKCEWKCDTKHDLQSQSHFCIVAETPASSSNSDENASRNTLAFIQYRFCWYRVEEKKHAGNVSTDKISELVIFIDNLVYDSDATAASIKELETAKVILASLALVHAARVGIWFGMMESPSALVPFFTKYFRMSNVSKEGKPGDSSAAPLVLDIKKCHFKYAILLLEEGLKSTGQTQLGNAVDERMIVNLSSTAKAPEVIARQPSGIFSSSKNVESQSKKAHIRLARGSNAKLFSVSMASAEGEEGKEATNAIDPTRIDATAKWDILRLFPLGASNQTDAEAEGKSDSSDVSEDIFMEELRKKQLELNALESSIETTSRGILSQAYNEHTTFASGERRAKINDDKKKIAEYEAVQKRIHEAEMAWQAQLDQDMDAVCDVCFDGEVTPENQIIFCDACNVAVHQNCYGIDQIPSGNYFCHTCTHFEVDKEFLAAKKRGGPPMKLTRHPIVCELCPRRQGAFVQVQTLVPTKKVKWVHVGCAKWQGMNYVDVELKDEIEDLTVLKGYFKAQNVTCALCKSGVGALHQCREEGCNQWLHLTCARSFGKCSVQHGENCDGYYDPAELDNPPWTLACQKHSEIDPESVKENSLTAEQLVAIADSYPPEPVPPKPFSRMNATERKEYWSDRDNLADFFDKVMPSLEGAKCHLCEGPADPSIDKRCDKCGVFSHADCADPERGDGATCLTCRFIDSKATIKSYEDPRCHMCPHPNNSGGPLVKSSAKPVTMKAWKKHGPAALQRSIFGKNKFCHALCGMWNALCETQHTQDGDVLIEFSEIAMSNGRDHVSRQHKCFICGLNSGAKVDCCIEGCVAPGSRRTPPKFHVTCARLAGLEVQSDNFTVKCFNHVDCSYVFRARLEDMREIELNRNTRKVFNASVPITWSHASSLFHTAVNVLRTLGWAWRWAEWWVEHGDNWEPLLEDGQVESEMTDKELKIVESDSQSRCNDARRCRLAAFSAAIRNREYDNEDGDDEEPLERALTAIIGTDSLAGPLKKKEIDFYVTWLALAYRSKSPALGFGEDKAPVATDGFCVHQADGSPKYELGTRPLPGKAKPDKGVFEPHVEEVDDFLKTPLSSSPPKKTRKKRSSIETPSTDGSSALTNCTAES